MRMIKSSSIALEVYRSRYPARAGTLHAGEDSRRSTRRCRRSEILGAIMEVIVPLKSDMDHAHETAERSGLMEKPVEKPVAVG